MKIDQILMAGLAGTSLMTLFSYLASSYKKENFREPVLLAELERDMMSLKELSLPAGWSTHFSMGIIWAVVFAYLFERTPIKPNFKNGLILGSLSGVIAVAIWKLSFKIHPNPPRIDYNRLYGHLVLAHLVYATTVTITLRDKDNSY